jgi:hypothetical protein
MADHKSFVSAMLVMKSGQGPAKLVAYWATYARWVSRSGWCSNWDERGVYPAYYFSLARAALPFSFFGLRAIDFS